MFTLMQSHEYIITYTRIIEKDLNFCKVTLIVEIDCVFGGVCKVPCDSIINTLLNYFDKIVRLMCRIGLHCSIPIYKAISECVRMTYDSC